MNGKRRFCGPRPVTRRLSEAAQLTRPERGFSIDTLVDALHDRWIAWNTGIRAAAPLCVVHVSHGTGRFGLRGGIS